MRLADYILTNIELILMEWEEFAREIWPGEVASSRTLRDHAGEMILAVARNMKAGQAEVRQDGTDAQLIDIASDLHATNRAKSGFHLQDLVAEYRALRSNVIRLWGASMPESDEIILEDIVRFNEAIDRLLAESVLCYVGRVNRSREIFLAILGHDLRNPIHAITLQAAMLAQSGHPDPVYQKIADQISASAGAMCGMVGDLLDYAGSHLGSGMKISPIAMHLDELCREVVDEMKTIHPERSFVFETTGSANGEWDRSRLRQLISNLLGNALQHGCPVSPIRISIHGTDGTVRLEVSNRGPVIAPEFLPLIFEPLKRDTATDATRPAGSIGLGLYIAREVVTAHGGMVDVQSNGERTTFIVRLPRRCAKGNSGNEPH
jgi:signal transduction histidine kinase